MSAGQDDASASNPRALLSTDLMDIPHNYPSPPLELLPQVQAHTTLELSPLLIGLAEDLDLLRKVNSERNLL